MSAHGFLCSQYTISSMKKMAISVVWNIKHILWMASWTDACLHPMLCWFIICGIVSIINLTATGLISTSFLVLSTWLWSTMAVYFVLCHRTVIPVLKRNILLELAWNAMAHLQTCCYWVRLWISPSQVWFLMKNLTFATPSSLIMVLLHLFLFQKWHQLFLLFQLKLILLTLKTPSYPHFFDWTPRLLMRRAISQGFPGKIRWCLQSCLQVSLQQMQGRLECSPSQYPHYLCWHVYWRHPITCSYLAYLCLIPNLSRTFNIWSGGVVCECPQS